MSFYSRFGRKRQISYTYLTWQQSYSLYTYLSPGVQLCVYQKLPIRTDVTIVINTCNHCQCWKSKWCNYRQSHIFLLPLLHSGESNNTGKAQWQSWNESLKSRCIPGRWCRLYEWYKGKIFCCAFFDTALMKMVAATTIVRFPLVICDIIHLNQSMDKWSYTI